MNLRYPKAYGALTASVDIAIIYLKNGVNSQAVIDTLIRGLERAENYADGMDPDAPVEPDAMAIAKRHAEYEMEKEF